MVAPPAEGVHQQHAYQHRCCEDNNQWIPKDEQSNAQVSAAARLYLRDRLAQGRRKRQRNHHYRQAARQHQHHKCHQQTHHRHQHIHHYLEGQAAGRFDGGGTPHQLSHQLPHLRLATPGLLHAAGVIVEEVAAAVAELGAAFAVDVLAALRLLDPDSAVGASAVVQLHHLNVFPRLHAFALVPHLCAFAAVQALTDLTSFLFQHKHTPAVSLFAAPVFIVLLQELECLELGQFFGSARIYFAIDGQLFIQGLEAAFLQTAGCGEVVGLGGDVGEGAVQAEAVFALADLVEFGVFVFADWAREAADCFRVAHHRPNTFNFMVQQRAGQIIKAHNHHTNVLPTPTHPQPLSLSETQLSQHTSGCGFGAAPVSICLQRIQQTGYQLVNGDVGYWSGRTQLYGICRSDSPVKALEYSTEMAVSSSP